LLLNNKKRNVKKMSNIEKADKNFKVETKLKKENIKFYNCLEEPFEIFGLIKPSEKYPYFTRINQEIAETVNDGVKTLNKNTAGGRLRFKTDSAYIAISVKMHEIGKMPHFPLTGSAGFDLYERKDGKETYIKTFVPPFNIDDGYESVIDIETPGEKEFTINFPLYSGVKELYIGIESNAIVKKCTPYKYETPVVFYGSSITQGGCASRPGNAYESMISRNLDCDYINLGFSGSARAEDEISDYIKNLVMSIFVYDYDYNAPTVEHLENTHEKMFRKIRKAQPELPIIFVSRPEWKKRENTDKCFSIIEKTYKNALADGDKNVYLVDGREIMHLLDSDSGSVDDCHPNDLGFYCMYKKIGEAIEKVI